MFLIFTCMHSMEVLGIRRRRLIANIRFFPISTAQEERERDRDREKKRMIKTTDCVLLTLLSLFLLTVSLEHVEIVLLKIIYA